METGSRDYVTIPKGCGYVYAYKNQLYNGITRKPCYRKDDRAMRPIYGCPEKF